MTTLHCKLDWFAFTFPITLLGEKDNEFTLSHILFAFHGHSAQRFLGVVTNGLWEWGSAAGFYNNRITCPDTGLSISWKAGNPFAICELSGTACDAVTRFMDVATLAQSARGRATRIDLAVDIETTVSPKEFVARRSAPAFQSTGCMHTPTGDTEYVGSRKGARMARVYRYNSPHPRSHLLRVEGEYKQGAARMICDHLVGSSLREVCLRSHLPFGWSHPIWDTEGAEVSKIPARKYDSDGAETLRWLLGVALPSALKAHREGLFNFKEWFEENSKHLP
jgi:hypothetical protein